MSEQDSSQEKKFEFFAPIFQPKNVETRNWLIIIINWFTTLLIAIPAFIVVYKYMPEITISVADKHYLRLDQVISFVIVLIFIRLLVFVMKKLVSGVIVAILVYLIVNSFLNRYSFVDLFQDYKYLITYLMEQPVEVPFIPESASFRNAKKIKAAVVPTNEAVRNFAVGSSIKYFSDKQLYRKYGTVLRYFSIFKEIKTNWQYVYDPTNSEYYASARETVRHLSGDCDDYCIVMVTCIMAVGGEARIVRTIGHVYPEVKICKKQDFVKYNHLIREIFAVESYGKKIFFHEDEEGYVWLNFDYTDKYPGGKFMNDKIVGILTF